MLGLIKRIFGRANKKHISEIDVFLYKTRRDLPLSASQTAEIAKANAIAERRDHVQSTAPKKQLWEKF